jgi:uncharacterized zinc-type alcohol dehydrogenase-like protein
MTNANITGFAALQSGGALAPYSYEPPALGEHDVRIAITHCGICATDLQAIDDFYNITDYPFVPGHEVVGNIVEIGKDVPASLLGERVGAGWQGRACGKCEWCRQGLVHLCQDVVENALWKPYGGFSSSIVVDHNFVYPIPQGMPSEYAAVLMCAGISVFSPLHHNLKPHRQRIGIMGIGGLGHLAIQFASRMGYEVTAISTSPAKRDEAMALGAHQFLVITDREQKRKYGYYFDLVLCTAHGRVDWESTLEMLKKRGRVILTGFSEMHFKPIDLVAHELSISGSFLGLPDEMREMLHFSQENAIQPMVELMPMTEVNSAIQRLRENKARYRIVLCN